MKTISRLGIFFGVALSFLYAQADFESWVEAQSNISIERLLANISPEDGHPGVVLASPSRENPDYYYHWVRDAALVMKTVLDLQHQTGNDYTDLLLDYAQFSRNNQRARALGGLGEPKFYVDGKPYDGPWGRPQNDGPALRAIVLIEWAHDLLDRGEEDLVRSLLYDGTLPTKTVIKTDLEL